MMTTAVLYTRIFYTSPAVEATADAEAAPASPTVPV